MKASAIFVADRKPVKKVLDRHEPDALQIRGTSWTNSLEVLKRRLKRIHSGVMSKRDENYWTMVDAAFPTRISLIREGSSNGASMLMPDGFSGVRE